MLQDARGRTGHDGNLIEHLYHLRWNLSEEKYKIHQPAQWTGTTFASAETTETPDGYITIADFHSNGSLDAYFSDQDNQDERRFRFYGVLGRVGSEEPEIALRVGVYGHWQQIHFESFFAGPTTHKAICHLKNRIKKWISR